MNIEVCSMSYSVLYLQQILKTQIKNNNFNQRSTHFMYTSIRKLIMFIYNLNGKRKNENKKERKMIKETEKRKKKGGFSIITHFYAPN